MPLWQFGPIFLSGTALVAPTLDGGGIVGNARGASAVDLQTSRAAASQVASAQFASIGGGTGNTASATGAVVSGGSTNLADGTYSWAPGGLHANARGQYGKGVVAAGRFASNGDAQRGYYVQRRQTTDNTPSRITADGGAAGTSNTLNLPPFGAYIGRLRVIAKAAGSTDAAAWEVLVGAVRGNSASTTTVFLGGSGAMVPTGSSGLGAAWRLAIGADTTNGGIAINITASATLTVNTVATFDSTETFTAS